MFQLGDYAVVAAKYRPKHKGGTDERGMKREREGGEVVRGGMRMAREDPSNEAKILERVCLCLRR